jgi:hypothetical protein
VAEAIFARPDVKEFASENVIGRFASRLERFARLPKYLFLGDRPGDRCHDERKDEDPEDLHENHLKQFAIQDLKTQRGRLAGGRGELPGVFAREIREKTRKKSKNIPFVFFACFAGKILRTRKRFAIANAITNRNLDIEIQIRISNLKFQI